jgi:ParB-like chromosome segregation protein Spo0J
MKVVDVDIETLIPDPENARTHDDKNLAAIRGSIKQFDVVEPLVVWKKNNVVLGGNGRLEVMKKMGFKTAPVHYVDLDDKKAKALALALNRTAELADWNMDRLKEQLAEIDEPELIGFDEDFVKFDDDQQETKTETIDGSKELDESDFDDFDNECPKCGFEWDDKK